ncbi:hypothetical protein ACFU76_19815, partial [Streptomyces sp. NPDC057539]|uniref:hypothetical protein n=1 Tax=Streptomyces sp. NPDC057539 TaxID=3346159 RepID=UPI00369084E8
FTSRLWPVVGSGGRAPQITLYVPDTIPARPPSPPVTDEASGARLYPWLEELIIPEPEDHAIPRS